MPNLALKIVILVTLAMGCIHRGAAPTATRTTAQTSAPAVLITSEAVDASCTVNEMMQQQLRLAQQKGRLAQAVADADALATSAYASGKWCLAVSIYAAIYDITHRASAALDTARPALIASMLAEDRATRDASCAITGEYLGAKVESAKLDQPATTYFPALGFYRLVHHLACNKDRAVALAAPVAD